MDLEAALPYPELALALEAVLRERKAGKTQAPERLVMPLPEGGTLLLMPASDQEIVITKLVTVHPQQRPSVRAELVVMNARTGERLAQLDGSLVTARRTAALSLLAAQKLAPRPPAPDDALLVIGAGVQGRSHLEAFRAGLGTRKVAIASRSEASARRLLEHALSLGMEASIAPDVAQAASEALLIVSATTSPTPVLSEGVREDAFIAAVGAYRPDMAELSPALVRRCRIFVDTLEGARAEAGDLIQAGVDWDEVTPLEDALELARPQGPVLFKSVGHALWDLAAARLVVRSLS
ncbi:delta(1)-pyrroline-2-carboxylate reductase family protein [Calidithermus roseus]|uniref:Delta(1)-pyrroline-2-carboxylate reductase 1 n=1 Tax=Calidithermus roseus TaxID=1644118 RepID=A0A399EQX1_9DEIN|nr:delta(1)-pyrroline-2-carboxylate reductase family protein [Calidithermus roseus]RIH85900.1 Delta(1)-pyrroline-2-carboxylate reductase 1 [Calidithermus roseus]